MLRAVGNGILVALLFLIIAGMCLIASSIADYFDNMRVAYTMHDGAIAIGVIGLVIAVLVVFSGCVTANAKATNSQRSNTFIFQNGQLRQVDPRDIPSYINGNPQGELPRGSNQIQLDQRSLEALALILNQQKRYLPRGKEDRSENITEY